MTKFREKYLNPFTGYGFKRLFCKEPNKDPLLDFLNELLKEQEGEIKEILYLPSEKLPISHGNRKAVFDLYCTNGKGEKFIVELQKTKQKYFKDRILCAYLFKVHKDENNDSLCLVDFGFNLSIGKST